jgi:hypothetical protein
MRERGRQWPAFGLDVRLAKGVALRSRVAQCSCTEDQSYPFAVKSVHNNITLHTLVLIFYGDKWR